MQRLVIIGHSHTEPVAAAAAAAGVPLDVLNFWHLPEPFIEAGDRLQLKPALRARLLAPVFSLVGGNVHQDVGLVVHPRRFDFVWPERPDLALEDGAEIIPYDAVQAALSARAGYFLDIMSAVRDATSGPVFHIESPPTYGPEILPRDDAGFAHFFGKDAEFSPPWLRFKLWRVHSDIVAAHCRAIGIQFLAHPPEAVTEAGFLRDAYHGTPAHANAAYGALVLAQMRAVTDVPISEPVRVPTPPETVPEAAVEIDGRVDSCVGGVVRGWAWVPGRPAEKLAVEVVAGEVILGQAIADMSRADLAAGGKGDGTYGFSIDLALELLPDGAPDDGAPEVISAIVRVRGGAVLTGGTILLDTEDGVCWPPLPWRLQGSAAGFVEQFGPAHIAGWAHLPAALSAPVGLEIWEAETRVGVIVADQWRNDLEETRQGDGRWGFAAPLPDCLRDNRLHLLRLCQPNGTPVLSHIIRLRLPPAPVRPALPDRNTPTSRSGGRMRPSNPASLTVVFSILVNFYNMRREAERTLTSLVRAYQRGIGDLGYEVLCIDNFSDPPLDPDWVAAFGPEFRLIRPTRRRASPCAALNEAAGQARGSHLALMIDGAHLLTPGALREAWDAVNEAPEAVVALRPWFVGGDQRWLASVGYTGGQEDMLFDKIGWPADGYRLFDIGGPYFESPRPWFDGMIESNCLFVPAALYHDIGGMDERFDEAGAGYANLDLFLRAVTASPEPVVALVGEATFHQFHGGTTTNVTPEMKESRVRAFEARYVELRGQPYPVTSAVDIRLRGQIRTPQAVSCWQRPPFPGKLGATERIRPGSLHLQFDNSAQDYVQSVYVENGLHHRTMWLGHRLDIAPADAMAIQGLVHRLRPQRIVTCNVAPGVLFLLSSIIELLDLPASWIIAVGDAPVALPDRVRHVPGPTAAPETLAAIAEGLGSEERVLVLFVPDAGDLLPINALRAYADFVTARSYLIFLGTAFGQPWLGYSRRWYRTAVQRLLDEASFTIDETCNPHLISTSPNGYLQRIEPPSPAAEAGRGRDLPNEA